MAIKTVNPVNGKTVKEFDEIDFVKAQEIIGKADEAFNEWKKTSFAERAGKMKKAAEILKNNSRKYGEILTLEMGKPVKQAVSEIEKCAWVCEYYAENAEKFLSNENIETDASESYVEFDPLGVVLAVMPWNFPFWQVFRFAAPALMAGNVGLLKHASNVPQSALAIEEVFMEAGFPEYTFKTLLASSSIVDDILEDERVKAATLTGSEYAGKKVAGKAGSLVKKTVLELGGSDPFILLSDADVEEAVEVGVKSRLINNGESCIAAKRFIVTENIYDEFEEKFVKKLESLKVGDPMDEDTDFGPLAREDLLEELHKQVQDSLDKGATLLTGGHRIDKEGYWYAPTAIRNIKPGMPAYEEELFGPVASIFKAKDDNDAIRIANDSPFGLGASLWSRDTNKAKEYARKIESGNVFINGLVKSDPRLPFGGVKTSGYGRELSHYGIKEFVNIKTVWVK